MQRALIAFFRCLPLWLPYGVMALVIPFYMLFGKGFRTSYRFFRKRIGKGRIASFFHVWKNFYKMGQVVLDRFAAFAGKSFTMDVPEIQLFHDFNDRGAFIMLGSHIGCYELAGYTLKSAKPIHTLVFPGETQTVRENRKRIFDAMNIDMISVSEDLSHVFAMNNALSAGEIVSIPGDRLFGSSKSVSCTFFNDKAPFPMGPFVLAAQRDVPLLQVSVMKEGLRRYRIYLSGILVPESGSVREKVQTMADAYASNLEQVVRRYPHQWFNFFDFWNERV